MAARIILGRGEIAPIKEQIEAFRASPGKNRLWVVQNKGVVTKVFTKEKSCFDLFLVLLSNFIDRLTRSKHFKRHATLIDSTEDLLFKHIEALCTHSRAAALSPTVVDSGARSADEAPNGAQDHSGSGSSTPRSLNAEAADPERVSEFDPIAYFSDELEDSLSCDSAMKVLLRNEIANLPPEARNKEGVERIINEKVNIDKLGLIRSSLVANYEGHIIEKAIGLALSRREQRLEFSLFSESIRKYAELFRFESTRMPPRSEPTPIPISRVTSPELVESEPVPAAPAKFSPWKFYLEQLRRTIPEYFSQEEVGAFSDHFAQRISDLDLAQKTEDYTRNAFAKILDGFELDRVAPRVNSVRLSKAMLDNSDFPNSILKDIEGRLRGDFRMKPDVFLGKLNQLISDKRGWVNIIKHKQNDALRVYNQLARECAEIDPKRKFSNLSDRDSFSVDLFCDEDNWSLKVANELLRKLTPSNVEAHFDSSLIDTLRKMLTKRGLNSEELPALYPKIARQILLTFEQSTNWNGLPEQFMDDYFN